jgi:hypothetical protein
MRTTDFQGRFLDLLHETCRVDAPLDYPHWDALRKRVFELMSEAGDEARCAHTDPLYQGKICMICGRKPSAQNTLPPGAA